MKVRIQIGSVLSIAIRVRLRVLRFWCGAGSSLLGFGDSACKFWIPCAAQAEEVGGGAIWELIV